MGKGYSADNGSPLKPDQHLSEVAAPFGINRIERIPKTEPTGEKMAFLERLELPIVVTACIVLLLTIGYVFFVGI
jgi:hypothetical protein